MTIIVLTFPLTYDKHNLQTREIIDILICELNILNENTSVISAVLIDKTLNSSA
jgi:hypothetical protein